MTKYMITPAILLYTSLFAHSDEVKKRSLPLSEDIQLKGNIIIKGLGEKSYSNEKTAKLPFVIRFDEEEKIFQRYFSAHSNDKPESAFSFLNGISISIKAHFNNETGLISQQASVSFYSYSGSSKEGLKSLVQKYSLPQNQKNTTELNCKSPDGTPLNITLNYYIADVIGDKIEIIKPKLQNKMQ